MLFQISSFIDLPAQTHNSFSEGETLKRAFNARLDIPKGGLAGHALPPPHLISGNILMEHSN